MRYKGRVALPVRPPVAPMLARLARELPPGALYEPKWDGFRALVFRDGDDVEIRSRHDRPLARYFPELVGAVRGLDERRIVLDGEIVVPTEDGFDFAALMARLHPAATRVERLAAETPARFVAFDLLAVDDRDTRDRPFVERRERLVGLLADAPAPLVVTPVTDDPEVARTWLESARRAIDGVVAKAPGLRYEPGVRAMVKVKTERTAECVIAGFRWKADEPVLGSLLLGLYDADGPLRHVGVVTSFTAARRAEVLERVRPLATGIEGHPWERGFGLERSPLGRLLGAAGRWVPGEMELEWVPLRPELVAEVAYDHLDAGRFRHPARLRRWRPDRDPRSCTLDQLDAEDGERPALLARA